MNPAIPILWLVQSRPLVVLKQLPNLDSTPRVNAIQLFENSVHVGIIPSIAPSIDFASDLLDIANKRSGAREIARLNER